MFDAFKPAACRGHHVRHSLKADRICEAHRSFVVRRDRIQCAWDRLTCSRRATLKRGRVRSLVIDELSVCSLYVRGRDTSTDVRRAGQAHVTKTEDSMIRKLKSGQYRLYSRKVDPKTGRRRNLGTFSSRAAAEKHERAVQFFKRHG